MTTKTGGPPVEGLPHLEEIEEPMTTLQSREIYQAYRSLDRRFAGRTVSVETGSAVAYDRRDLRRSLLPDVFVAFEVPNRIRERYLPWKEGKPPDWVLEVASATTAERDRTDKLAIYAALGVREVVLFDPDGLHHPEILAVHRLAEKGYEPVAAGENGRFASEVLELELAAVPYWEDKTRYWTLRFFELGASEPVPTEDELIHAQNREIEANNRRIAELEAELARLRRPAGK